MTLPHWLGLAGLFTALLWMPYVLERIAHHGLKAALGNPPKGGVEAAAWAQRAHAAHQNAIENLVVFGALATAAHLSGAGESSLAQLAGPTYVGARVAHFIVYTAGIPGLRTLTFAAGAAAQMMLAAAIFL